MPDNVELNLMVGGQIVATDLIGGAHYQRMKIVLGADGANDGDVSSSNKLPARVTDLETLIGEVAASPTANTVLARLKSIEGYVDGIEGYVDGIEGLIGTTNTNTGNAATSLGIMDDWDNTASDGASVSGDVAHDGIDAGEPVKVGMRALAHGTNPTAVAAADRTDWLANRAGVPWVMGGHPNIVTLRTNYTGAQTDAALVTVAGGLKIVVTRASVMADNANTVDVAARIGFGAASTPTGAGTVLSHPGIARGSGVVEGNGSGMLGVGADGEDLRITSEVPTGGSIDVMVSYYTIES